MSELVDRKLYTPMIRQYLEIKDNYPDTILFYRIGDFYELFFNDAIVGSKELEIVLTSKEAGTSVDKVPMCGVPFHAIETYIERLSERGYRVAIVEQMDLGDNQKICKREVTRIITPGTNIDNSYLSEKSNNYLASLEKIDNGFAFAYLDLSTGEGFVTKLFNKDFVASEIQKLSIKEIICPQSLTSPLSKTLAKSLGIMISPFDSIKIDDYLENNLKDISDDVKNPCRRLLSYVTETQKRTLLHLKKFSYYELKEYLRLSNKAVKSLELVESIEGTRFNGNLFSTLDYCETAMGSRFLRKSILFPLINPTEINRRLDIISDLIQKISLIDDIKKALSNVYDIERIIGRISFGTLSPKDLVQLKKSLMCIRPLKKVLDSAHLKNLKNFSSEIPTFDELAKMLDDAISEDAPFLLKDGGVIKRGFNNELDQIRDIETTNKDFLINLEKAEKEKTGIKSLRVGYNRVFGYYIEVTNANLSLIKDEYGYIRKQTTTNSERFITQELKERETLILRSAETALKMEIDLFNNIRSICMDNISGLQKLADKISYLDMLNALAKVAKDYNYVRPSISLYDQLEIINGRHPVVEQSMTDSFIPNDLILQNNEKILLITGPNMAGKSTYMRQNALIVIMAQMGSFVPADKAIVPIFDQIFTRIGSSDNLNRGESSFMTEMLEVNDALTNATEKSLIIFDEVGRGTATFDGMALAQAILEYLHNTVGAKTFFSTHYHELTRLENDLSDLRNVHVEARVEGEGNKEELIFMHKVLPGATDKSYGVSVASLAKIPLEVTLRAKNLLDILSSDKATCGGENLSIKNYQKPIIVNNLKDNELSTLNKIREVDPDNLSTREALNLIFELKEMLSDE